VKDWWNGLSPRDRRTLGVGGLLALLLLGYALVWLPMERSRDAWRERASAADANLIWMRAAAERMALLAPAPITAQRDGRSLLAVVDAGVREVGLGGALLRVEPINPQQVRVYFQQAGFDTLMDWLRSLGDSHGVRVTELSVQRAAGVGLVDARLLLETAAP
jgi:general secretion pathway protein M